MVWSCGSDGVHSRVEVLAEPSETFSQITSQEDPNDVGVDVFRETPEYGDGGNVRLLPNRRVNGQAKSDWRGQGIGCLRNFLFWVWMLGQRIAVRIVPGFPIERLGRACGNVGGPIDAN